MREEINRLTTLQAVDQQLKERQQALSKISQRLEELQARVDQVQNDHEQQSGEDLQANLTRRDLERSLAEGEAQIRNKRMRLTLVKNDRELQALQHEVDALKESNQRLESELLARIEGSEQRAAKLGEVKQALEQCQAELLAAQKEVAADTEELRAAIVRQQAEREALANGIETSLRQRYEMIFSRRGGLAVVTVRSGTCQGCRMRIPPQLYNELQRSESIHSCPNCQRILYYEG